MSKPRMRTPHPLVEVRGVDQGLPAGTQGRRRCRGVDLKFDRGEFAAHRRPSGSGKSTLLNLIGTLDSPDERGNPVTKAAASRTSPPTSRPTSACAHWASFPSLQPDPGADRRRERGVSARAAGRRRARSASAPRTRPCVGWASRGYGEPPARHALRRPAAARGRGPRHRPPARSSCSPTSRRRTWTRRPAARCSISCRASTASTA